MRCLVDAQLPPGLARHLASNGHSAEHVNEVGLAAARDADIWAYAVRVGAVLITKDADFVALTRRGLKGVPVVWIRLGNTTNAALWARLEPLLSQIEDAVGDGEKLVEII